MAKLKYLGTRVIDQNVIREEIKSRLYLNNSVTVQICYSSSWMLLFSSVISGRVTDLLASYDLFFVSGRKITPFLTFSLNVRKRAMSPQEASL